MADNHLANNQEIVKSRMIGLLRFCAALMVFVLAILLGE